MKIKILAFLLMANNVFGQCTNWSSSSEVGELPSSILAESSGMQYSHVGHHEYLYHHNDSGGGPYLYRTDLQGNNLKKIKINNYQAVDPEGMSVGPCPQHLGRTQEKCLYLADIGDNRRVRSQSTIIILKESDLEKDTVTPVQIVNFKLPLRTDAESFAVHPNGEIYLATKESGVSYLFRLKIEKNVLIENIGRIDLSQIAGLNDKSRATDMAISPDGKKFVLLTYDDAVIFNIDLGRKVDKIELTHEAMPLHLEALPKQESITFVNNDTIDYSTEAKWGSVPIMQSTCLKH